jgi:plastocyanin
MQRSFLRVMLTLITGFALAGVTFGGAIAQHGHGAQEAHPSHIHAGSCAELDPNPAYPLSDVAAVSADAAAVQAGVTTVDVALDELVAGDFALNVHESAENVATYIACGDIAGPVVDDQLVIGLLEQSDSGYAGVAVLAANADGGTDVTVYLGADLAGTAAGTAVAADAAVTGEVAVAISDFAFDPGTIEVPVGTTITWTNEDSAAHTATSVDKIWDSNILEQGESFSYTFEEAGTFDYLCSLHPSMLGQIVVTEP